MANHFRLISIMNICLYSVIAVVELGTMGMNVWRAKEAVGIKWWQPIVLVLGYGLCQPGWGDLLVDLGKLSSLMMIWKEVHHREVMGGSKVSCKRGIP